MYAKKAPKPTLLLLKQRKTPSIWMDLAKPRLSFSQLSYTERLSTQQALRVSLCVLCRSLFFWFTTVCPATKTGSAAICENLLDFLSCDVPLLGKTLHCSLSLSIFHPSYSDICRSSSIVLYFIYIATLIQPTNIQQQNSAAQTTVII